MKRILSFCVVVVTILLYSCKSSYIVSTWKSANAIPKRYNKVMVVAMIREEDRSWQEQMEQHMTGDLQEYGYNAVSALKEYGPKAFQNMTEDAIVEKIKSRGVDAVMTIVLLNKDKETRYYPGHPRYYPTDYYHSVGRYYYTMWNRIQDPGYYVTNTRYLWESNLYDITSKDLLYSVQTQSFDPISAESIAHEYGKMIVKKMVNSKILEKQTPLKAF